METANANPEGNLNSVASKMVLKSEETGHPIFTSASALVRGILRRVRGKANHFFTADASNTKLLFRTMHSVNKVSILGAVSDWSGQHGQSPTDEKTEPMSEKLMKNEKSVNPEC